MRSGRAMAESMEMERPLAPSEGGVIASAVGLARAIRPDMRASELADELMLVLRSLLPGRQVVVRLRAHGTHAQVGYAVGTPGLVPFAREELWISRAGLALFSLAPRDAVRQGVCVIEDYEPELEREACGFDVPLFDGSAIVGVVGVEYERGTIPCLGDRSTVAHLALQLAAPLANAGFEESAPNEEALDSIYERTRGISVPPPIDTPNARERQAIQIEKLATLGQLAAGIVHELNNPLTSIAMYSQHLRRRARTSGLPEEEVQIVSRIEAASERVLRLTRELMGYARPASESTCPLSIENVIDRALLFCGHVLRSSNVVAERRNQGGLPAVRGSEAQLQQVVINLVTNACQAMEPHGGKLEIHSLLLPTGHVEIRLIDEGPGVPPADREAIFEPFFSTKPEGTGTGLGLSIVRTIVQQHGGAVFVDARDGRPGAVFSVQLPSVGGRTGVLLPPAG